jgi:hypothetical protein
MTLAIATGLWAYRIHSTAIEIEAVTTDLEFKATEDQPITEPLALRSLGFTGAELVDFPPDLMISDQPGREPGSGVQLALADPDEGSITMARLSVPTGARVEMHDEGDLAMRVVIDGPTEEQYKVEVTIEGKLMVGQANGRTAPISITAPKLVTVTFGGGSAELDLTLQSPTERALAGNLEVTSLGLSRIETLGSSLAARPVSGVKWGELILQDLADQSIPIRAGSELSLTVDDGELRNAGISDEGIRLHFAGTVRGMRGGSERRPIELMPTALEWLMSNQRLALIWTAVAYLFGVGLAANRWWKGEEP